MKLKLADGLSLPLDVVTQKLAWLGVTGSGKTYGASKLAELLWHAGAQFVVLDPVGVWYGLRLAKDGKKPSDITIPIFGGLHADVPLEPTGGALLANLVVDKTLSAIIDVSQFESDAQKARFALDFAERFFFRKKAAPSAVHVFLEECQEFVPQNPQKGDERMLHAFTRMQKLGRNFGIGSSYLSQRPQEVNKKALNMAQTLFVFRTTGTHERTAIEKWIEDKSLDETIANDLPKIATGDCHVWSPEFLKISETVHILEKATFNASATPEVGVAAKARELAPIDLDKVRAEMAATIEKAKADDPRELRKQLASVRAELAKAQHVKPSNQQASPVSTKPVQVLTDADRALLATVVERFSKIESMLGRTKVLALEEIVTAVKNAGADAFEDVQSAQAEFMKQLDAKGFQKILGKLATVPATQIHPTTHTAPRSSQTGRVAPASAPATSRRPARLVSDVDGITPAKQRILNALAFLHGIGVALPRKAQVALVADTSPNGGSFINNVSALRTAGFIEYPQTGCLALTVAGQSIASTDGVPTSSEELHQMLRARLPPAKWRLVEQLIAAYPDPIEKVELAARAQTSATGGSFINNVSALRTFGLLDYPRKGLVVATPVLFLEGR